MRPITFKQDGQAAVETAIVFPLFIFMVLGLLQMTLLYESRAMLKLAAYRAARAGAMNNACKDKMTSAALSALVPVISLDGNLMQASDAVSYGIAYGKAAAAQTVASAASLPIIDVRICGPLKKYVNGSETFKPGGDNKEVDFDDPANTVEVAVSGDAPSDAASRMRGFERTKLRVQVKYYQRLIIPFANWIIFKTWQGAQLADHLRMGAKSANHISNDVGVRVSAESDGLLGIAAMAGAYYLPLYANYGFRMQSNFFLSKCPLPEDNRCWHYNDGAARAP